MRAAVNFLVTSPFFQFVHILWKPTECVGRAQNGREWFVSFTVVPSAARVTGIPRGLKRNSGC